MASIDTKTSNKVILTKIDGDKVWAEAKAGQTIAEIVGPNAGYSVEVFIDGVKVPRHWWNRLRPKTGTQINVQIYPQGGTAGKILKLVIIAVIAYFTFGAGAGAAAAWLGVGTTTLAVIGIVAILAVNALIPPPSMKSGNSANAGDPFKQLNSITGTQNQINPYGPVPCVVGTMRWYPPHAAMPYTEVQGDDQYLRMMLDLGYGDLDVSDIRIGDTSIDAYQDVEYEISTSPSLFVQDIFEDAVTVPVANTGDTGTRTSQLGVDELSLDLVFDNGLYGVNASGGTVQGKTSFSIFYSPTGANTWTNVDAANGITVTNGLTPNLSTGTFDIASSERKTLRASLRWKVATNGQYDVRVTRNSSDFTGSASASATSGGCVWTVLRSITHQNPSTTGTTKLAVRIKATDQLNGVIQNMSVLTSQKIKKWDKVNQEWTATAVATQNPADICAWLYITCPAIARRVDESRVNLDNIADWSDECTSKGLVVSFVMSSTRAYFDVLQDVYAAGRAAFGIVNGKYGAVLDLEQTVPVQVFTPANSWDFSYSRTFANLPDAVRVSFTNPEAAYQEDEIIVYDDGKNANTAQIFDSLQMLMVTDPTASWKLGKYHLAAAKYRPVTYHLSADIEQLVCERGDMVRVQQPMTQWGESAGRILSISGNTITITEPFSFQSNTNYSLQIRHKDTSVEVLTITNPAGGNSTIQLSANVSANAAVGDLYIIGSTIQPTNDLVVQAIKALDNYAATLTLVDYSNDVITADSNTMPTFVSNLTHQPWCQVPDPPQLKLTVTGSTDDRGTYHPGVGISAPPNSGIVRGGIGGGGGIIRGRTYQK